jgi:SAM-dependent methyltransferase
MNLPSHNPYTFKGSDPFGSHAQIADLVKTYNAKKILDVGCNDGFIGRALEASRWKGSLVGIDIMPEMKRIVGKFGYKDFIKVDLETELNKVKGRYDGIVFGDILEHVTNSEEVLTHMRRLLTPGGICIITLPNVANIYIRLQLLLGKFDYTDRGILDQDHKHLYTKKSAIELIKNCGMGVLRYESTPIPLPLVSPVFRKGAVMFPAYELFYKISRLRPTVFGFQHLLVCR